ncbi:hypothetical protein BK131_22255 [Paenibacillus amylolyticus]|uniref:Uncharacterized protein n=1 Tax=Paenibacillus amylolyticus TaxID=1451 RepID=A0A1R1BMQ2_PAEAM|nr:hypothetical protein [Paenibacillus amylolyticus]OMF11156.1 hypothetical protein BK131_22255 [Paenibacillus amylolyticus]
MEKKNEKKRDFIGELSVINKNKFSLQQTQSLYLGILYELILNKEIFPRNKDLTSFIKEVFKTEFNEYLFKARPYLASRLLKHVFEQYDSLMISASIKLVILYLQQEKTENNSDSRGKKSINNIEDDVVGWFNSVSKGSNEN